MVCIIITRGHGTPHDRRARGARIGLPVYAARRANRENSDSSDLRGRLAKTMLAADNIATTLPPYMHPKQPPYRETEKKTPISYGWTRANCTPRHVGGGVVTKISIFARPHGGAGCARVSRRKVWTNPDTQQVECGEIVTEITVRQRRRPIRGARARAISAVRNIRRFRK